MKTQTSTGWLQQGINKVTKAHFAYAAILALQIIIYDAAQLITPAAVLKRWQAVALIFVVSTAVWLLAKERLAHKNGYRLLIALLALADVVLASMYVYQQRGMASRAVVLYLVAIATIAVLRSRSALFATAAVCVAAYTMTAIKYFVDFFNEGYKVELYGEIGFYSAIFFVVAGLIWAAIRPQGKAS